VKENVMQDAAFRTARWVAGLATYAAALLGLAYACASAERGVVLPWVVFFAPLSGLSHWVPWDGPIVPMLVMFFGVALEWPLAGFAVWLLPATLRRSVATVLLLVSYASAVALAATSLNASERAILGTRDMGLLVAISFGVYLLGQLLIWRKVRTL
jgi:hypothetical protein